MTLSGLNPCVAAIAFEKMLTAWLELMQNLPEGETSTPKTDALLLAELLLAREDSLLLRGNSQPELDACLSLARSGPWADLDEIPWLLIQSYVTRCESDLTATQRVQRLLGHHNSSIRLWFHTVAWMIRTDLEVDSVRPILLQNIADKLEAVMESAGLLAVLHPDKSVLDSAANSLVVPGSFEVQYGERFSMIRHLEWNSQAFNLWRAENNARKVIWASVRETEVMI